jgi:hypothetical protein
VDTEDVGDLQGRSPVHDGGCYWAGGWGEGSGTGSAVGLSDV